MTADVVGLYSSIPHKAGLRALKEVLKRSEEKTISIEDLLKMAEFLLKNNYFDLDGQVKYKISGTAIRNKFETKHACIFTDEIEIKFPQTQGLQTSECFRYININILLYGQLGEIFRVGRLAK